VQVDTTNILFVCGGAFDGWKRSRNRTERPASAWRRGAQPERSKAIYDLLKAVEPEDLTSTA
jgi:ATP-dependent protease Clp ATPase subunit